MAEGASRVKPSVYLRPIAQTNFKQTGEREPQPGHERCPYMKMERPPSTARPGR